MTGEKILQKQAYKGQKPVKTRFQDWIRGHY
jgi:hypothetical protein